MTHIIAEHVDYQRVLSIDSWLIIAALEFGPRFQEFQSDIIYHLVIGLTILTAICF